MILGIDHLVLTGRSIEATCAFYERALGVVAVTFGEARKALALGPHKINLHEVGREFEPKARIPTSGSGDFCLLADEAVEDIAARLRGLGIAIEEGPVERAGARGPIRSIYFRDPDGNLVEVANQRTPAA